MHRKIYAYSICCLLAAITALPASAAGRLADITVIDRDSGTALPIYSHQGELWVAGTPGTRYAISVRSKLGQRLMAVAAVDGVDVLSGQTAAWHQNGYVFSGYSRYQITGWRTSTQEVAAFEFSSLGNSYAALTGRPANVGVIGVALFREKPPVPKPREENFSSDSPLREYGNAAGLAKSRSAETPGAGKDPGSGSANEASSSQRSVPQATAILGTAHGQQERSVVGTTTFERLGTQPDEMVLIRYDSRANLLAMGVIRTAPIGALPAPNAFPDSQTAFVPDPPIRRY